MPLVPGFAVCERRGGGSDNNRGVMVLEDKEEGCQRACTAESLDYLPYIVGIGTGQHLPFFRLCSLRRQENGRQAADDGDALMFWETNLARLPLFIPSQGEMLFYKG